MSPGPPPSDGGAVPVVAVPVAVPVAAVPVVAAVAAVPVVAVPVVAAVASAGGVEALKELVRGLPADLPAAVLVALHLPVTTRSLLAQILDRHSALPVATAEHGTALQAGHVLVGPPDAHLLVRAGRVVLGHGPRENAHRPSHDAMLRSVALAVGPLAVAVVLTGMLDDGAVGLAAVARYGGCCLVQDPDDAEFPSMPQAALVAVPAAVVRPLAALGAEVVRAVTTLRGPVEADPVQRALDETEDQAACAEGNATSGALRPGAPYTCPSCSGPLRQVPDDRALRFRCGVGHAWTSSSLDVQQGEQVEVALQVALRVLEERSRLSLRLSWLAQEQGHHWQAEQHAERAEEAGRSAALVWSVLARELAAASGGATTAP